MPAAAATSSMVTCSKPLRRKSSSAACSIRARVSARASDPVSVTAHILRHLRPPRLPVAPGATSVRRIRPLAFHGGPHARDDDPRRRRDRGSGPRRRGGPGRGVAGRGGLDRRHVRRLLSLGVTAEFDPALAWRRAPSVALRPEPFGALVYSFRNRKLSFLKSRQLVEVVEALGEHPSARAAP